jgi:hypothetical protein
MDKKKQGRPKGSTGSHFVKVKMSDLANHIGGQGNVVVSKRWLQDMGIHVEEKPKKVLTPVSDEPKIQFKVTH